MKKAILLLALLFVPLASAIEFSPSNFVLDLDVNEVVCKNIFFKLESFGTINDLWASDSPQQWTIAGFNTSSDSHNLQISYPSQVSPEENEIEFCVSGSRPDKYRGALLIREGEVGNSIMQIAIWLDVTITGEPAEDDENDSNNDHDSSSGFRGSKNYYTSTVHNSQESPDSLQQISYQIPQDTIQLNKKTSEARQNELTPIIILAAVLVIILIALLILFLLRK